MPLVQITAKNIDFFGLEPHLQGVLRLRLLEGHYEIYVRHRVRSRRRRFVV